LRDRTLVAPERKEMKKIFRFFKESFAELKKVTWPSREEVASSTKVVLVSVILIAIALGIVDFFIFRGIDLVF
jgi:preprotein translocase subunit SecE